MTQSRAESTPTKTQRKAHAESSVIKLLPAFIQAIKWNHKPRIEEVCVDMAASVEPTHPGVAKKIRDIFGRDLKPVHLHGHKADGLISFEEPKHSFKKVILPAGIEASCRAIVQEHHRREDLAAYGLSPRHRVLLHGSPGNGKTMLAEALAYELEVPFLRVKYGAFLDSYLGGTGKNLEAVLDYASAAPCLLFLDEFDGIGMDRGNNRDVGEMRRITNQLLISLERVPSTCFFVAATNAPGLIDSALNRRFDVIMEIPSPTSDLKLRCAQKELAPEVTPGYDVVHLAKRVAGLPLLNLYEVVELCKRIRRDLVLNSGAGVDTILSAEGI